MSKHRVKRKCAKCNCNFSCLPHASDTDALQERSLCYSCKRRAAGPTRAEFTKSRARAQQLAKAEEAPPDNNLSGSGPVIH
jgi:hypothetical protein